VRGTGRRGAGAPPAEARLQIMEPGLRTYILKRIGFAVLMLVGVSIILFTIMRLAPGGPEAVLIGGEFSQEAAAQIRQRLGLDRPLALQYLGWAGAALRGDLGRSFKTGDPVAALILDRLRTAFGDATFGQAQVPLYLTATDFHTGEQVVFDKGPIVDAVRASIAIPYIFRPWPADGRVLVDGFMSDPMPIYRSMSIIRKR